MKKATHEIIGTVFEGWMWAIVLAWPAIAMSLAGWRVLPAAVLPLLCAYFLGAERGYRKWKKMFDVAVEAEKKGEQDDG